MIKIKISTKSMPCQPIARRRKLQGTIIIFGKLLQEKLLRNYEKNFGRIVFADLICGYGYPAATARATHPAGGANPTKTAITTSAAQSTGPAKTTGSATAANTAAAARRAGRSGLYSRKSFSLPAVFVSRRYL
ncbi:hypothetical protein, partial [Serratia sp. M24T3]|uniref:hypothetical protein n=1 Tax=Serratia sp. M24T3 TaxID=932213 RepID=UPI001ED96BF6